MDRKKKLATTLLFWIAGTGSAAAADLQAVAIEPSWTSMYVGGGIGYAHADHGFYGGYELDTCTNAVRIQTDEGLLTDCGLYGDFFTPFPDPNEFPFIPEPVFVNQLSGDDDLDGMADGAEFRAHIGADYEATDEFVVGVRFGAAFGDMEGKVDFELDDFERFTPEDGSDVPWGDFTGALTLRSEWSWEAIARMGYLVHPSVLAYWGLGVKQRRYDAKLEWTRFVVHTDCTAQGCDFLLEPRPNGERDEDFTATGGTVGVGVEALLGGGRWSVGVEGFYTRYQPNKTITQPGVLAPGGVLEGLDSSGDGGVVDTSRRARDVFVLDQGSLYDLEVRAFANLRMGMPGVGWANLKQETPPDPRWTAFYLGGGVGFTHADHSYFGGYDYDTCSNAVRVQTDAGLLSDCGLSRDFDTIPFPDPDLFDFPIPDPIFVNILSGEDALDGTADGPEVHAQIGADYHATENIVVGIRAGAALGGGDGEVDFGLNDFDSFEGPVPDGDFRGALVLDSEWSWNLITRMGLLARPNLLVYGALGVKQRRYDADLEFDRFFTDQVHTGEGSTFTFLPPEHQEKHVDFTATGGTVGAGIEALLGAGRWSVGAEGFYTRYQTNHTITTSDVLVRDGAVFGVDNSTPMERPFGFRARDTLVIDQQDLYEIEGRIFANYRFNLGR
jgi:opacity protein-like surface antigen